MIRVKALIYGRQMMRVNVITNILHCPPFSLPAGREELNGPRRVAHVPRHGGFRHCDGT